MAVAAVQELETPVADAVETEVSQETVPSTGSSEEVRQPGQAKEDKAFDLTAHPKFREWQAAQDRKTEQLRQAMLQTQQQAQRYEQALREKQLEGLDDFGRLELRAQEAEAKAQALEQKLYAAEVQQQRAQALAQIASKYKVPMEAIEAAGDPAEARDLAWEWREKQLEQENTRSLETQQAKAAKKEANRVEVGSGKPSSPDGEWEREYQRLLKAGDNRGAIRHALTKPKE
jgi:adenine-specific DNA glycosylase